MEILLDISQDTSTRHEFRGSLLSIVIHAITICIRTKLEALDDGLRMMRVVRYRLRQLPPSQLMEAR